MPTMSWDLLESPDFARRDTSSLYTVGGGGAPAPPEPRVVGPARMDMSAVEERLAQARRKSQTTIAVALFGLVAMTLFAWFVVNLSRPQ